MPNLHLQNWFRQERDFTEEEEVWLQKLLGSIDFPGRDALISQLKNAKVIGNCLCGCKTIDIKIDSVSPRFPYSIRVPVEMLVHNDKSAPVVFYLHVIDGYIKELEVFKADSERISERIELDNAEVKVNIKND